MLLSQTISSFWNFSASINGYLNVVDSLEGILLFSFERPFQIDRTEDLAWLVKINSLFMLPGQMQIQLSFICDAPKNIPQGRQLARSSVDPGVKKSLWKEKGELFLSVTELFNRYGLRQKIAEKEFEMASRKPR